MPHRSLVTFALLGLVVCYSGHAAATDQLDLNVGLKTLPLLTTKLSGQAPVGVVFDPAIPASKADADGLKSMIDANGDAPGGVKLVAQIVSLSELSKLSGSKIVLVAAGTGKAHFDEIAAAVNAAGALSISTDLDCVKAGKCILGIVSKPSVEIFFSKTAADGAHVGFAPAFTMLAKPM